MYTVTYTNNDGNQMRLLLTDAEFERGLHRAQENAGDLKPQSPASDNRLREIVGDGDPCSPDNLSNKATDDFGRQRPDTKDHLYG